MPYWKPIISSAVLATAALAQEMPVPELSGYMICDGTIRPDYDECRDSLLPQTFDGVTVGPEFMQGQEIKGEDCQFRALKCGTNTAGEFVIDNFSAMYPLIERECGEFLAGGIYRSGDACIYIDTPNNTFGASTKRAAAPEPLPVVALEKEKRKTRRDLVKESRELGERQCDPPDGPCYTYVEQTFLTGIRGFEQRVCDSILPNGGRCDQSRSITTTESFSFGVDIGVGIKDIVDVTASFSQEVSSSTTETITTAITVDCPDGGYVVWYPLMEISSGSCGSGPQASCSGGCIPDTTTQCQYRKPITSGEGRLSGEYDVQCV